MILDIGIAIALFIVGAGLFAFGGLQILTGIFCGFPLTSRLSRRYGGKIAAGAIYMKLVYTIVLWLLIIAAATFVVIWIDRDYSLFGFLGGMLFVLAFSIGRIGINDATVGAYLARFGKFIQTELREKLVQDLKDGKFEAI